MTVFTPLYLLVPAIAFLYASVGFGGATGYLAVMSFYDIPPQVMASSALVLNTLVASIAFSSFYRAGHLRRDLLTPFLITSIPAAFLGGYLKIGDTIYTILLYLVLSAVAVRLLFFSQHQDDGQALRPLPIAWALAIGLGIGLLSGIVGIGGGIFLSPLIIFARWGSPKQAAAVAAAFIVLNSISGLLGRFSSGNLALDGTIFALIPLGFFGALAGSNLGAQHLSSVNVRRSLGIVMSVAVSNFWLSFWR